MPKNADGNDSIRRFIGTVFKSLRFHLCTLEKERFQKVPVLKPFSKASVFISVLDRFSVDDRRKRTKKYAFSCENALVRASEKDIR